MLYETREMLIFCETKKLAEVQIRWCSTLIGLLRSGLVMRSQSMPAMAIPTHSQVKKLKRLMTEKMSLEVAYNMDRKH